MQGQLTRPTEPSYIAHADTPNELWWTGSEWVKAPALAKASGPTMDAVVQAYNAIRDARTVKRKAYDAEDLALEADQNMLKTLMLELLNTTGAKSIATNHGTAYRSKKLKVSAADWTAIYDWVMQDMARFDVFEKRLKSTFVKEFQEANDGATPPGINTHEEYEVSVRRPTNVATTEQE